eukprot:TRINITY_DN1525_c0_g2_i1.p1 TRINITY_DN1525_c0_g2~~TRINITY_DN1525_c0_g2_i1.p1  ORF type:complete len:296 (+),score=9.45 TRINITY_DN1525_c0_g2_i1:133-1020(+)
MTQHIFEQIPALTVRKILSRVSDDPQYRFLNRLIDEHFRQTVTVVYPKFTNSDVHLPQITSSLDQNTVSRRKSSSVNQAKCEVENQIVCKNQVESLVNLNRVQFSQVALKPFYSKQSDFPKIAAITRLHIPTASYKDPGIQNPFSDTTNEIDHFQKQPTLLQYSRFPNVSTVNITRTVSINAENLSTIAQFSKTLQAQINELPSVQTIVLSGRQLELVKEFAMNKDNRRLDIQIVMDTDYTFDEMCRVGEMLEHVQDLPCVQRIFLQVDTTWMLVDGWLPPNFDNVKIALACSTQ